MRRIFNSTVIAGLVLALLCICTDQVQAASAITELKQGFGAYRLGDRKSAIKHYSKAIKKQHELDLAERIEAYRLRALCYNDLKKYKEGVQDYHQAIKLARGNVSRVRLAQLYMGRGAIYLTWRKKQKALADLNKAQKLAPELSRIYYYRGNTHFSLRQHKQALSDFNRAIRLERRHQYFFARSKVYMSLDNRKAAIKDMEKAVRLKPARKSYINRLKYLRMLEAKTGS